MIPATGIQDQELPIAPKRAGVNYPAIARRCDLRAGMSADRQALPRSTDAVRGAEFADFHAVNRQPQVSACRSERNRWDEAAGILKGGQIGARRIFLDRAGLSVRRAGGGIEA